MVATDLTPDEIARFTKFMETYSRTRSSDEDKEPSRTLSRDFTKDMREFDGDPDKYWNWAFRVKIAMKTESKKLHEVVVEIEKYENKIDMNKLAEKYEGYEVEKFATELYDVLGKKLDGHALTTLRNVEHMNGLEVWRILQKDCNPTSPVMLIRSLVSLVVPKKSASERTLAKDIDEWEVKVKKSIDDHGPDGGIGEKLQIAIVTAMCPNNMVETIYQHVTDKTSYAEFRKNVKALAETRVAMMGTPMDGPPDIWASGKMDIRRMETGQMLK